MSLLHDTIGESAVHTDESGRVTIPTSKDRPMFVVSYRRRINIMTVPRVGNRIFGI
ncbi:hypothetical protein D3OALGB2SA_801 [Olavius algarvensis associated proteobacterium Delta 3]|nr:hypothetical protein D3OALGB2SA_801 [Olavius algarvensis associated proteobacterium Delta 3]